jgi:putative ABC transport system permease protein
MLAVGLVAAIGFLSVVLVGSLQHSLLQGFERLGADLLVVNGNAQVNLTQALLTVEPEAPPLAAAVLEAAEQLPAFVTVSPQRGLRSSGRLSMDLGLGHDTAVPLYGIDPTRDTTVLPWLEGHRGIDFQAGQVILGHRVRGRLGDRLRLLDHTFQIYGRLAPTGVPSHENGLFFTLADLDVLMPSGAPGSLGINGLLIQGPPDQSMDQLRFSLLARLDGVKIVGGRTLLAMVRQGGMLTLRMLLVLSAALLLSVLLLISLYYVGLVSERRQELGLLLTLGATPQQLVGLLVGESSVLCASGGALGLGLAALLLPNLHQLVALQLTETGLPFPPAAAAPLWRLAGGLWLLMTTLGALAALLSTTVVLGRDPLLLVQNDG